MMKLFDMQEEFYSSEIQLPRKNGWTFGNMKNDDTTSSEVFRCHILLLMISVWVFLRLF